MLELCVHYPHLNAENAYENYVENATYLVPKVLGFTRFRNQAREEVEEKADLIEYQDCLEEILNKLGPLHR